MKIKNKKLNSLSQKKKYKIYKRFKKLINQKFLYKNNAK